MSRRLTKEIFISKANLVHRERYTYDRVIYVRNSTKIIITCLIHGDFTQTPAAHLIGQGCPLCGFIDGSNSRKNKIIKRRYQGLCQPKEYKLIPLTRGEFAMVDNEDFEMISKHNWSLDNKGYAINRGLGLMHRYIMNAPRDKVVDHANGATLDNRRLNLRICEVKENIWNSNSYQGTSKFKGVSWHKRIKKWASAITCNRKRLHIGYFESEIEAAEAYDKKAVELHGEFALINFKK